MLYLLRKRKLKTLPCPNLPVGVGLPASPCPCPRPRWVLGWPAVFREEAMLASCWLDERQGSSSCSEPMRGAKIETEGRGSWKAGVQFCLFAQSCLTLCNPMDCSMPGFPVHHQLPEPTQTHVHHVGDAIQPSHPLSFPFSSRLQSFLASGSFPMSQFFTSGSQSIGVSVSTSVLPMNIQA